MCDGVLGIEECLVLNFSKSYQATLLQNICEWLLLEIVYLKSKCNIQKRVTQSTPPTLIHWRYTSNHLQQIVPYPQALKSYLHQATFTPTHLQKISSNPKPFKIYIHPLNSPITYFHLPQSPKANVL